MFVLTNLPFSAYRGKPAMPKLRANLKISVGRGKPPRSSPAAAPTTPTVGVPVVVCQGTYTAAGTTEAATEKMAGKKSVTGPTTLKMAEASANDAARFIAMKQEMDDRMAADQGGSPSHPGSQSGKGLQDPRQTLKTIREGTRKWYGHMDDLHETLHGQLEVIYPIVTAPEHFGG